VQYSPLFNLDASEKCTPISSSFPACFYYAPAVKSVLLVTFRLWNGNSVFFAINFGSWRGTRTCCLCPVKTL